VVLALALALAGCADGLDVGAGELTTSIVVAAVIPQEFVNAPTGRQLAWLLRLLNTRGGRIDTHEVEAHYHPRFLAWKPVAEVITASEYLARNHAPLEIRGVQRAEGEYLDVLGDSATGPIRVRLWVDDASGLIRGLLVEPYVDLTMEQIARELTTLAPRTQFLVAEVEGGVCMPMLELDVDQVLSIASTSKLYILLALIDSILAGERAWDDRLAVRDAWKSTPGAALSEKPDGELLTLRAFAEALIAESDNTANDHLIRALGREAVEDAVRASAHHEPGLNVPYMTSQEFFRLRALPEEEVGRYLSLDEEERRAYLDRVLVSRRAPEGSLARNLETVGIFASAEDLCRLLAVIAERARRHGEAAPALEILGRRRSRHFGGFTREDWAYAGGKGGSIGGATFQEVSSGTWLLRRVDGRWFVVVVGLNTDGRFLSLDRERIAGMMARVFDLLAQVDRREGVTVRTGTSAPGRTP
jgi:hypothetical protein